MIKKLFSNKKLSRTVSYLLVTVIYLVCQILLKTGNLQSIIKGLLVPICCYIVVAVALNLVVGISGELSLGHAGFMSIGAYSAICVSGILSFYVDNGVIRLIVSMFVGAIIAGIFGFLIGIPVLKLSGDYLAIVTLAFGQIIKGIINNLYLGYSKAGLQFSFINNDLDLSDGGKALISGPMGATGTIRIASFTAGFILIIITLVIVYNLMYSRDGRAIMAARDNRIAAESIGISVTRYKMLAFVISAALAGAAGALYSLNYTTLAPAKFDYNLSILILVYVVLGGLGNILGTIIATITLVLLPELLRSLNDYRMLIYAVVLILIMIISNNQKMKQYLEDIKRKLFKKGGKSNE